MSHSKMTKRGRSQYVESWNPAAKKYIHTCALCGKQGYSPALDEADFEDDSVRRAIRGALSEVYREPLALDEYGRCPDCAGRQDG
ncbi:MAG: hypothetical protein J6V07_04410 [Clostridia bacterium]|nr:hypothetical protein [Clostridia bacterium]